MSQVSCADVNRRRVVNSNSQERWDGIVGNLMFVVVKIDIGAQYPKFKQLGQWR